MGGVEHQQFSVNKSVERNMQVNLDITVAMPCEFLTIKDVDISNDQLLAEELIRMDGTDLDLSGRTLDGNVEYDSFHSVLKRARRARYPTRALKPHGNACRIYGSFPVNKVAGNLYISAKADVFMGTFRRPNLDQYNFTHRIDELSFGAYYPKLLNPLDGVIATTEEPQTVFQYFLSIVPTTYKSSSTGRTVHTNQYAVTEHVGRPGGALNYPAGLFFKYDIEPVSITISDRRMPFSQFLVRTVNIIGGIVVCTSWLFKLFEATFGKTWRSRDSHGYLDKPHYEED